MNQSLMMHESLNENRPFPVKKEKQDKSFLFIKILYVIITVFLFILGWNFISYSKSSELHKEYNEFLKISNEWNNTYFDHIIDWRIFIKNNQLSFKLNKMKSKFNDFDEITDLEYMPLHFELNNLSEILKVSNLNVKSLRNDYNLTTNLTLIIDDGFSIREIVLDEVDVFIATSNQMNQNECVKNRGVWKKNDGITLCYTFKVLRQLCIILNQEEINSEKKLDKNYRQFKCNGYNEWYESFSSFTWLESKLQPNLENFNKKITLYVSNIKDPYVWALYNSITSFDRTGDRYYSSGIILIILSIILVGFPIIIWLKRHDFNEIIKIEEEKEKSRKTSFILHKPSFLSRMNHKGSISKMR